MSEEIKKENNDLTKNKIPFVKIMPIAAVVSSILFIVSIGLFISKLSTNSFNMGIDFAGGVELKVQINNPEVINIAEIRSLYNNFGTETVNIQELEGEDNINAFLLRFRGSNDFMINTVLIKLI